jgi:hypothetical protein
MSWRWIAASSIAALAIVVLAATGQRPEPGLVRFQPAGVMLHIAPDQVAAVEVQTSGRSARFDRDARGMWHRGDRSVSPALARRLDEGLKLLHGSAPQRTMTGDELSPATLREFALDPPRYSIAVATKRGETFVIDFGDRNSQALAQYARVRGRTDVVLLGRYVGEPWQSVIDGESSR